MGSPLQAIRAAGRIVGAADDAGDAVRRLLPVAAPRTPPIPPTSRQAVRRAIELANTPSAAFSDAQDYQRGIDALAEHTRDFGATQEYIDFLAAHDVPQAVISRVASGELEMSDVARAARAREIGINPDRLLFRYDRTGKPTVLGRYRNGLQYTSFTPEMALSAAQAASAKYPVWGPAHVAGLDKAPSPLAPSEIGRALQRIQKADHSDWAEWEMFADGASRPAMGLAQTQSTGLNVPKVKFPEGDITNPDYDWAAANEWLQIPAVRYGALERGRRGAMDALESDPSYGVWDPSRSMIPELKRMGYQGVLVADEAPRSVAFFGPSQEGPMPAIRHSALSALDPEFRYRRNMFMSVPVLAPLLSSAGTNSEE